METLRPFSESRGTNYFKYLFFSHLEQWNLILKVSKEHFSQGRLLQWQLHISKIRGRFFFDRSSFCTLRQLYLLSQIRATVISNQGSFCHWKSGQQLQIEPAITNQGKFITNQSNHNKLVPYKRLKSKKATIFHNNSGLNKCFPNH